MTWFSFDLANSTGAVLYFLVYTMVYINKAIYFHETYC